MLLKWKNVEICKIKFVALKPLLHEQGLGAKGAFAHYFILFFDYFYFIKVII
jgi:hypothetical protein